MEATEERRTFDKVIEKLRWLGGSLKSALYFGGLDENSLNRMKAAVEELNQIEVSDFIGSWLKTPENNSLLEVWVNEILNTYFYHKEVETANFKPQQLGDDWVMIAKNYDAWRNTIIYKLSRCLPDGAAMIYEGKMYVMFPDTQSKTKEQGVIDRQKENFKDCIFVQDKEGFLERLHKIFVNKKGKYIASVISVCVENGLMKKPTFAMMKDEFGDIGAKSGFNKYMTLGLDWKEKKPIENTLKGYL